MIANICRRDFQDINDVIVTETIQLVGADTWLYIRSNHGQHGSSSITRGARLFNFRGIMERNIHDAFS